MRTGAYAVGGGGGGGEGGPNAPLDPKNMLAVFFFRYCVTYIGELTFLFSPVHH